jgi:hypothetical protein
LAGSHYILPVFAALAKVWFHLPASSRGTTQNAKSLDPYDGSMGIAIPGLRQGQNPTMSLVPCFQQLQARTGLKGEENLFGYTTSFRTKEKVFAQSVLAGCRTGWREVGQNRRTTLEGVAEKKGRPNAVAEI